MSSHYYQQTALTILYRQLGLFFYRLLEEKRNFSIYQVVIHKNQFLSSRG